MVNLDTELTATVAAAVEPVVAKVLEELQGWGIKYEAIIEK